MSVNALNINTVLRAFLFIVPMFINNAPAVQAGALQSLFIYL
ncbi:hypothetical protein RG47T_3623 [Mucilaginibacter polytrichastri]|uniref:Uncharacterized protein n=1 Tax=Mucilaginibacter polytrichastri TaxID=1302689 RepID=A0A1Q6A2C5_9SPHI|nr:hypothetical protein RG47T_3623 [Mucilaginibacter polytrichastri]